MVKDTWTTSEVHWSSRLSGIMRARSIPIDPRHASRIPLSCQSGPFIPTRLLSRSRGQGVWVAG